MTVTSEQVRQATARIRGYVHRTPGNGSEQIDRSAGCHLLFKGENLRQVGALKALLPDTRVIAWCLTSGVAVPASRSRWMRNRGVFRLL